MRSLKSVGFTKIGERRPDLGSIQWVPELEGMQVELRNRNPPEIGGTVRGEAGGGERVKRERELSSQREERERRETGQESVWMCMCAGE